MFNLLTRKIEFAVYMEMLKDASNISEVKKEVEKISKNAVVWSHMRSVEVSLRKAEQGIVDSWFVCNKSCDHPATPIGQGRAGATESTWLCAPSARQSSGREAARKTEQI